VSINVDGVVFGVRRLDRVMPTGSTIIVTRRSPASSRSPTTRSTA
jgi:hypothetical protein